MSIADLDHQRHAEIAERLGTELHRELVVPCELCGGHGTKLHRGWDENDLPVDRMTLCSCRSELDLRLAMFDAGIPREFHDIEALVPELNVHAFDALSRYADRLDAAMKHGLGLILTGRNGTGKTSSACIPLIRCLRERRTAAMISWPDYVDGLRRAWKDPALARHLDRRAMRDLVVLDELGKEHETNDTTFVAGKLDSILRMRRGAMLPTIVISNLNAAQLVARYGASIESLLADRYKPIAYRPGDFRVRTGSSWDALIEGGK